MEKGIAISTVNSTALFHKGMEETRWMNSGSLSQIQLRGVRLPDIELVSSGSMIVLNSVSVDK